MAKKGFSRRTFIKGTSLAIAGAVGGGKIAQQGIFAPNVVHAQDEVVLAIQEFAHDAIKAILPEFESATGLTVKLEGGPVSGNDMLTKYSTAFAAGNSPVDVISDADESSPTFIRAGWIMPLDDIIPQETWDDFPESMQGQIETFLSYDGQRYRVPHEFAVGYFFTRKDWLDEKNVSSPTTWDEMVEIGKEFTDSSTGVWGTTDGLVKPGLLYVFCAYLAAQSGGSVFDFDEGTADAFQFLYDMIHTHKIFPETALNQDYTAQNELYMGDKVAFMRQWPFFQSVAEANTEWFDASKMAIELPPAGAAGSKSWWGGWGFSLPASAPNPDGAQELIKFLTSPENAPKLAEGQSWFVMPRTSILDYFADKPNVIVEAMGRYSEANALAARPFHPRVAEAQTAVEDMASLFLTDQAGLADVMKQGQQLIADLEA
ncbi:extracellular solute-binding protein [Aggregatilinea lenta]|uniref:extracellular solute-binding protein n=1 Tax=Aggregatilinea lenta TaxID=913108 RepID=UPI0013C31251|nr:extracellular solute-binding protein [Aggregatilinea lenta]